MGYEKGGDSKTAGTGHVVMEIEGWSESVGKTRKQILKCWY